MPTHMQSVSRAVRVTGVQPTVVMWIDHENAPDTLCLNAALITEADHHAINAALTDGRCTARELISALVQQRG